MNCEYVFQYLEDHMPMPNSPEGSMILRDLNAMHVDVLQYSWFQTYAPLLANLSDRGVGDQESLMSLKIDKNFVETEPYGKSLYYISLTSVFRKRLYTKILRSGRPIVRRYDPRAPFDVEQQPKSTWYLPLQFALTTSELGVCLDDDHLVVGSSAISRGLYAGSGEKRGNTHYAKWSLRGLAFALSSTFSERDHSTKAMQLTVKGISGAATIFDTIVYSVSALVLNVRDSKMERAISGRKNRDV